MFEERCVFVSAPELLWGSHSTSSRAHEHGSKLPKVCREIDWQLRRARAASAAVAPLADRPSLRPLSTPLAALSSNHVGVVHDRERPGRLHRAGRDDGREGRAVRGGVLARGPVGDARRGARPHLPVQVGAGPRGVGRAADGVGLRGPPLLREAGDHERVRDAGDPVDPAQLGQGRAGLRAGQLQGVHEGVRRRDEGDGDLELRARAHRAQLVRAAQPVRLGGEADGDEGRRPLPLHRVRAGGRQAVRARRPQARPRLPRRARRRRRLARPRPARHPGADRAVRRRTRNSARNSSARNSSARNSLAPMSHSPPLALPGTRRRRSGST